ncbi:MAG: hypothetical protein IKJ94_06985 [Oscillospiraceae bacterium]|nr:hypothetical protein [Oscillospiraceae bacterium]
MELAKIFSDNMVLQAGKPIRVFGTGKGAAAVTFCGITKTVNSTGERWELEFPPMPYGGPFRMEADLNGKPAVIENIMVGQVILFAGQSNMAFCLKEEGFDFDTAEDNLQIRNFILPTDEKSAAKTNCWQLCKKENLQKWSAVGYHAAIQLAKEHSAAIGMIELAQGASIIQSFMSPALFDAHPEIALSPEEIKALNHTHDNYFWNEYGHIYHNHLQTIVPFAVGNIVWYQGESNATEKEAPLYKDMLKVFLQMLRTELRDEAIYVVVVQICDYTARTNSPAWKTIQDAQMRIQQELANVVTVTSKDVCSHDNIHPPYKGDLGKKVAAQIHFGK